MGFANRGHQEKTGRLQEEESTCSSLFCFLLLSLSLQQMLCTQSGIQYLFPVCFYKSQERTSGQSLTDHQWANTPSSEFQLLALQVPTSNFLASKIPTSLVGGEKFPQTQRFQLLLAVISSDNSVLLCLLSLLVPVWGFLVGQMVKNPPARQETWVAFLGQVDPLEKEMATHSSILAWRIPWTEEPGGLQSMGSQRVGHD